MDQTPGAEQIFERFQELSSPEYPDDLQETLDRSLDTILRLFQADSGSVMLCKDRKHHVAACRGLPDEAREEINSRRDGSVSSHVIARQAPMVIQGTVDPQYWPRALPRPQLLSSISIPLQSHRKVLGLLNINSTNPSRLFNEDEMAFASLIGRHLAITIENARLREEAKASSRYFSDLYRIARTITSSLDLDLVLRMIAEHAHRVTACEVSAVLLRDPDTRSIQLAKGRGLSGATDEDYIRLAETGIREADICRRLAAVRDVRLPDDPRVGSGIVVPLTIKSKVVGYIAGFRFDGKGFPKATTNLLLGLGELAAIAVENARLYRRQSGIAHITQKELTPERFQPIRGYEIGSRYTPAHQVGGDYCDLIRISSRKFGLVVADVAGRNVTAALHIAKCKHAIRVLADCISSPSKLLVKLNRFIYEHTEPEAFISMFYAILDTRKGLLTYSVAGHEPGLLLRTETPAVEYAYASGILLGIDPNATFEERTAYLNTGDTLFLYTDGLVEALCSGQADGFDILKDVMLERRLESAQKLADNIHRLAIANLAGKTPDDIAIVALRKL